HEELLLIAHEHKINKKVIDLIREYTGAAVSAPNGFGNALDLLHILEVAAAGERERNVMSKDETLEVLLPHWVVNLIRVDLANRTGVENFLSVTDEQINAFFTARKLKVQWLYDFQNLAEPGAAGVSLAYPETVEVIFYPAGTYVKGTADVITLKTVYDSTKLADNDYLHLFTEQGVLVTNPCGTGRRLSIPLKATGTTGAANITKAFGVAAV
ncbi:MAG TPA: major capsid protein, partial [Nocardioides sp.]|nr:major capsid protein [Nocardioides sp.]